MKSAQQRAESAVDSLLKSPKLGWVRCFNHEKKVASAIILRETGLEGLVEFAGKITELNRYLSPCHDYEDACGCLKCEIRRACETLSKLTPPEA